MASFFKITATLSLMSLISGCATSNQKHAENEDGQAIENPFVGFVAPRTGDNQSITLRSRRGNQSVEVEMPDAQNSDMTLPFNQKAFRQPSSFASSEEVTEDGIDHRYSVQKPTAADREIAATFVGRDDPVNDAKRREIEAGLGLQPSDEPPNMDESYLAKVDVVKQYFHVGRFEAALIEIDHLVKLFPTSGKLFEMRGTVLDRLGYADLALRSWRQALEFQPNKASLKKLVEKREQQRSVASEKR